MPDRPVAGAEGWKPMALVATLVAAAFPIVWLAVTLTTHYATVPSAIVKIIFTIVVVLTAASGLRWITTSGVLLLGEGLVALAWVILRADAYPPYGVLRTVLLLIVPLVVASALLILAGGLRAGTWPRARFVGSLAGGAPADRESDGGEGGG